jgi:hypothetical protein
MSQADFKPLRNTALPATFRQIRLELAREPDHPSGASDIAYMIVAPLDRQDKIDGALWKAHRDAYRVVRLRPGEDEARGHLVHRSGGIWALHYDVAGEALDESGYHFADERFVPGEYVSVRGPDGMHAFRVTSISPL